MRLRKRGILRLLKRGKRKIKGAQVSWIGCFTTDLRGLYIHRCGVDAMFEASFALGADLVLVVLRHRRLQEAEDEVLGVGATEDEELDPTRSD